MKWFPIVDSADQQFGALLNNRRVTIRLRYNVTLDRWSMDLSLDNEPVIHGRRVVLGSNLLAPFDFGIGMLFAVSTGAEEAPTRDALVNGTVRLYHVTDEELRAALEDGSISSQSSTDS